MFCNFKGFFLENLMKLWIACLYLGYTRISGYMVEFVNQVFFYQDADGVFQ